MQSHRCVTLNVGGTLYTTTVRTLLSEPNSYFTDLFGGKRDDAVQAEVFIDRDGELFKHILRFLRASPEGKPQLMQTLSVADKVALLEEAKFFQLENMEELLLVGYTTQRKIHYVMLKPAVWTDCVRKLENMMRAGWQIVGCTYEHENASFFVLLML